MAGRSKSQIRPNDPTILITVIRVASASHRDFDAGLLAAGPERSRGVLGTPVRVVDHPVGCALSDGHVQSIGDQRCGWVVPDLYGAEPGRVLDLLRGLNHAGRVMVVGHEPTMSGFLGRMTGSHLRVPTGSLASLRLFNSRWAGLGWGATEVEL